MFSQNYVRGISSIVFGKKRETLFLYDSMRLSVVSDDRFEYMSVVQIDKISVELTITKLQQITLYSLLTPRLLRYWILSRANGMKRRRGVKVNNDFESDVWAEMIILTFEVFFI